MSTRNMNRRKFITTAAMAGAGAITSLVTSCNSDKPEPVPPIPPKPNELAPTSDRQPLTYAEWEGKGFPTIVKGANGAKFLISNAESQKFITKGVNADNIIIGPAQTAEVTIEGPGDFAAKAEQIKKHFADGVATVNVTLKQNIPATADVLGILNQKTITGTNVKWAEGSAAFVPATANQEIDGTLFANLPVGNDGDKRFYVTYENGSKLLTDLRGFVNTNRIYTSQMLLAGLLLQRVIHLPGKQGEIIVDTGADGTGGDAIEAENFSGYDVNQAPIKVIVQAGKKLVWKNATPKLLGLVRTDRVIREYNIGLTGVEETGVNPYHGPDRLFHLVTHRGVGYSLDEVIDRPGYVRGLYTNLGVESLHLGKGERLSDVGVFTKEIDFKGMQTWTQYLDLKRWDVGTGSLTIIEQSVRDWIEPIVTAEDPQQNPRWTQLPSYRLTVKPGAKIIIAELGYFEWLSKILKLRFSIGTDWTIGVPNELTDVFNDTSKAADYLLKNHNIVLDQKSVQTISLEECRRVGLARRVADGWVRGP